MNSKVVSKILTGIICLVYSTTQAEIIFQDSFETNDLSANNNQGFYWESPNFTSVVTQNTNDGPVAVYNGSKVYNIHSPTMPDGSVRNWTPKTSSYCLRFRYPAGQNQSEQRFNLGTPMTDVWIQYWIRVPKNFSFGTIGSPAMNAKFFALWMDGYETSGQGSTVWLGLHPSNTTDATIAYTYSEGLGAGSGGYKQYKPFVTVADRGRWMQLLLHVKAESSENANDGIIQTYRRWEGESKYTKLHEDLNAPLRIPNSPKGFVRGYIFGWVNAPYNNETEWLLDDFTISTTDLSSALLPNAPTALHIVK